LRQQHIAWDTAGLEETVASDFLPPLRGELTNMRARLASYDAEHYLISHEPPLSREYLLGFLYSLIEAGRIAGAEADLSRAKVRFVGQHGRAPTGQ
jgi:hypothetical protein